MADEVSQRLRRQVAERAGRLCEYCRIHEDDSGNLHHVDHIISRKHNGPTVLPNLAFACVTCNRYKGTDVASLDSDSGELIRLFNPRKDKWDRHFVLDSLVVKPLTAIGRVTVRLLKLNAAERIEERKILQELNRYPRS